MKLDEKTIIRYCRIVNLAMAIYIAYVGYRTKQCVLVGLGYAIFTCDFILLVADTYQKRLLQTLRAISALAIGPYLLFAQKDMIIRLMGAALVLTDGYLLVKDMRSL